MGSGIQINIELGPRNETTWTELFKCSFVCKSHKSKLVCNIFMAYKIGCKTANHKVGIDKSCYKWTETASRAKQNIWEKT